MWKFLYTINSKKSYVSVRAVEISSTQEKNQGKQCPPHHVFRNEISVEFPQLVAIVSSSLFSDTNELLGFKDRVLSKAGNNSMPRPALPTTQKDRTNMLVLPNEMDGLPDTAGVQGDGKLRGIGGFANACEDFPTVNGTQVK